MNIEEVMNKLEQIKKEYGNIEVRIISSEYEFGIEDITKAGNLNTGKNIALLTLDG
jgi:hypothetical protein